MVAHDHLDQLSRADQVYAIKTWRYLRLAMVALVTGLGSPSCTSGQRWIRTASRPRSAPSYYTPVHGFFVGVLVGVGVCLFCLKGSTDPEDVLLNLAGMFALVVALVPTQHRLLRLCLAPG